MSILEDLEIRETEIERASRFDCYWLSLEELTSKKHYHYFDFFMLILNTFIVHFFIFIALGFALIKIDDLFRINLYFYLKLAGFVVVISALLVPGLIILIFMINIKISLKKYKHFIKLYREMKKFNLILEGLDALDEAGRAGGSNKLENKEKIVEALTIIRVDLITALRIEKIFRENPDYSFSDFAVNLDPFKFVQMSEQASEYGRLFNEAIQIGMRVQEEMEALQSR